MPVGGAAQAPRPPALGAAASGAGRRSVRAGKFRRILSEPSVDVPALRDLLWQGAPEDDPWSRAQAWQILLGYLPPVRDRQEQGVERKRREYEELKRRHFHFAQDAGGDAGASGGASSSTATASAAGADVEEAAHAS